MIPCRQNISTTITDMRILLTGKHGQLGWELHRQLEQDYEVIALGREDIDFRDSKFMLSMLRSLPKCDLIVNAAAYTDVDKAEREPFLAEAVNAEAPALLATEADRRGIPPSLTRRGQEQALTYPLLPVILLL